MNQKQNKKYKLTYKSPCICVRVKVHTNVLYVVCDLSHTTTILMALYNNNNNK